jgi:hypothetical protein
MENIFKKAKENKKNGFGYYYAKRKTLINYCNDFKWKWVGYEYGIRRSNKIQYFPIWNTSNNGQYGILFGIWKLYFEIIINK